MKRYIKLFVLALLVLAALLLVLGSGDNSENMTEASAVSKSGQDNIVKNEDTVKLTREYYNWIYSEAFKGFESACKVTKLPDTFESALASYSEENKISFLRNLLRSYEMVSAIQTAWEYESKKDSYTHDVVKAEKKADGTYSIKMNISAGNEVYEKNYELKLSDVTKKTLLTCFDGEGNVNYFHEIVVTDDGYVAVNRAQKTNDTWSVLQFMFKDGETAEGYCSSAENVKETPESIYNDGVYAGFAGKDESFAESSGTV